MIFEGPGKYLVLPLGRVRNPRCKHFFSPMSEKMSENNPPCICVYPKLRIPFGWEYTRHLDENSEVHIDIIGPKKYVRDGYSFTYSYDGW